MCWSAMLVLEGLARSVSFPPCWSSGHVTSCQLLACCSFSLQPTGCRVFLYYLVSLIPLLSQRFPSPHLQELKTSRTFFLRRTPPALRVEAWLSDLGRQSLLVALKMGVAWKSARLLSQYGTAQVWETQAL